MFSKKRYFNTKWRYKWLITDIIVFTVGILLANAVWTLLGVSLLDSMVQAIAQSIKITISIHGLREKLICMLLVVIVIAVFLIVLMMTALPVFGIYLGIRSSMRKNQKQSVRYDVIQDIDYFRDEFKGISPTMISMLMDLKVERKKDVTATLLSLEQKGLIRIEDGRISIYGGSREGLTRSESYLLELAEQKRLKASALRDWEEASIRETVRKGFLTYNKDKRRFLIRMVVYIAIMILSVNGFRQGERWMDEASQHVDELLAPYEEAFDVDTSQMSFEEQMDYLEMQLDIPELPEVMVILCEMVGVIICGLMIFLMPFVIVASIIAHIATKPRYKRTGKGKLLTEQLAGMKQFIHDFSNLNEAEKEELVLWDEFLVYAVVLEENENIVKEIGNIRKVDLSKYRMAE